MLQEPISICHKSNSHRRIEPSGRFASREFSEEDERSGRKLREAQFRHEVSPIQPLLAIHHHVCEHTRLQQQPYALGQNGERPETIARTRRRKHDVVDWW